MADSTWTGAINTDWNTAGNWSAGVPGVADTATIPGGGPTITGALTNVAQIVLGGGSRQISGAFATSGPTLNVAAGATLTMSGNISTAGPGSPLIKAGLGTLSLVASNTYTPGTNVNGGTLVAGDANAFGTGSIVLAAGTTLNLAGFNVANSILTNGGNITGAPNYSGTIQIPAAVTFTVPAGLVMAGIANVAPTGKLAIAGQHTGTINNDGEVEVNNATAADPPVNVYNGSCGSTYALQQP